MIRRGADVAMNRWKLFDSIPSRSEVFYLNGGVNGSKATVNFVSHSEHDSILYERVTSVELDVEGMPFIYEGYVCLDRGSYSLDMKCL